MSRLFVLPALFLLACATSGPGDDTGKLPTGPADADADGYDVESDCDDADATAYPGADELCDGVDNDCDGTVDDSPVDATAWYADLDRDGYGDPSAKKTACEQPNGYVADGTDCNDASTDYHPGATETACTGPDFNCNGVNDEGDADGDGYASCTDCDDTRATVHPGLDEACDGLDNDCNGDIDEGAGDSLTFYADADGDLYGDGDTPVQACALPPGASETKNDCDDTDPNVHPGADEYCNGDDDDCDGNVDENPVDPETFYADRDGDTFGDAAGTATGCSAPVGYVADATDCDDSNRSVYPGAAEYCGGTDYDCDGAVNEADSVNVVAYYTDRDSDGYFGTYAGAACSNPAGTSTSSTDCDDADASVSPAAEDICNDADDDCDGVIDDGRRVPEDYATIQSAITAASAGDHVCVAGGTYYEDIDLGGKSSLIIEGEDGSKLTTISGTGAGPVVAIDNYEYQPTLRGFTIENGEAASGAGIYIYGSDATLEDLVVAYNYCTTSDYCYGTGMFAYGDLTIRDVTVEYNYAQPPVSSGSGYMYGTGVYITNANLDVDGLAVIGNGGYAYGAGNASSNYVQAYGIGMYLYYSTGNLDNVKVNENFIYRSSSSLGYATVYGIGLAMETGSASFDHLTIDGNQSILYGPNDNTFGGGFYEGNDSATIDHLIVTDNSADSYSAYGSGWLVYDYSTPLVTNALIAGNTATYGGSGSYNYAYGGGICSYYYASPTVINADIAGNKLSADYATGGGIDLDYYGGFTGDNISVYSNSLSGSSSYGGAVYQYPSYTYPYSFTYSNFYGNSSSEFYNLTSPVGSSGNVAVTPGYTNTSGGASGWNYTLTASSSLKNAGDPTLTDVDGSRSDIGEYGGSGGGW